MKKSNPLIFENHFLSQEELFLLKLWFGCQVECVNGVEEKVSPPEFNIPWASDFTAACVTAHMLQYFTFPSMETSASAVLVMEPVQPQTDLHQQEVLVFSCC